MTPSSSLLSRVEAGVAWITLNRPEQRNALDIPTLKQLHALLEHCNSDPAVRVLVLTGSGRSFCAGADLAEWAEAEARGALESYGWTETAHALMTCLHSLDKPTIAAINGTAVGGGMDLALCCDLRVAGQSARFKAGYTSMAYSPDAGASWHLPRLIGSEQAKRLLFLDELWSAERALAAGLVGEVCADEQLIGSVSELAGAPGHGPDLRLCPDQEADPPGRRSQPGAATGRRTGRRPALRAQRRRRRSPACRQRKTPATFPRVVGAVGRRSACRRKGPWAMCPFCRSRLAGEGARKNSA